MFHSKYAEERKRFHFHLHSHTQAKLRCRHDLRYDNTNTSEDTFNSSFLSIQEDRQNFQRHSESFSFTSEKDTNFSSFISNDLDNSDDSNNIVNKTDKNESPLFHCVSLPLRRNKALVSIGCEDDFISSTSTILE